MSEAEDQESVQALLAKADQPPADAELLFQDVDRFVEAVRQLVKADSAGDDPGLA